MTRVLVAMLLMCFADSLLAQSPFQIHLNQRSIPNLPGIHSYAFARHKNFIVFIGGRTDGLHLKQPWRSFHPDFNNRHIYVVNPITNEVWTDSISSLSIELQEQISSANMQFVQKGSELYFIGGYGNQAKIDDKVSFPSLVVINVPALIKAIQKKKPIAPCFNLVNDERMAVCGGQVEVIGNDFYLIGGHRFDGSYNPKGNPTYVQTYTSAIRKFNVVKNKSGYAIANFKEVRDTVTLHRRDYNLCPVVLPDQSFGFTIMSGVFQPGIDMPYRTSIDVNTACEYSIKPGFMQYYVNYHTANMGLFDSQTGDMHHIYFGGIGEYFLDEKGQLTQDSNVPFNKTVSRVHRDAQGKLTEYALPIQMEEYLGSACSFIPAAKAPFFENGVLNYQKLKGDSALVGYIFGGITAIGPNVFWTNEGDESSASTKLIEVWVSKNPETKEKLNSFSIDPLALEVYTNADMNELNMEFHLDNASDVQIEFTTIAQEGKTEQVLGWDDIKGLEAGDHMLAFTFDEQIPAGTYMFTITVNGVAKTLKIIVG